jgi:hypothetical protein
MMNGQGKKALKLEPNKFSVSLSLSLSVPSLLFFVLIGVKYLHKSSSLSRRTTRCVYEGLRRNDFSFQFSYIDEEEEE